MTSFWHPFADQAAVAAGGELVIDRGEGVHVWDEAGRRYLDATAGLWFCNAGYGRQEIADAAAAQLARMPHYSCFGDFANRPVLDLAERLAALAPVPGTVSFFTSGGSDAVDTAVKLVRRWWQETGHSERSLIAVRRNAYHGMHVAGTSLSGIPANRQGYGELLESVVQVPWDSADALAAALDEAGPAAEAEVRALLDEPQLRPFARVWLVQQGLEDPRSLDRDSAALLMAESLGSILDQDGPDGLLEYLGQLGPPAEQADVLGDLWRAATPRAAELLGVVARAHPSAQVAKAARKAAFKLRTTTRR